ncbi:MAG: M48 family metalloprotease [Halobacteria archaeon]|nr:M48 family metalloprotease [Halobacteria archaeon]
MAATPNLVVTPLLAFGEVSLILFYATVAGFCWFGLLTLYYAVLRKRRAVVSMFASFAVAVSVTLWMTAALLTVAGAVNYATRGFSLSWSFLATVVQAAYVASVAFLTLLFLANQWVVRKMFSRYRDLANEEVTRRVNETVDVEELVEEFDVGEFELLAVDDVEADAHTMVLAKPSLLSPKLGRDVMVVKRPLVEILEPDEFEAVVAHELAHIESLDARFRPYFEVLGTIYFFDPLVQAIKRSMKRLQEYGADDRAVEVTEKPEALARALVKVAEHDYEVNELGYDVRKRAERLASSERG